MINTALFILYAEDDEEDRLLFKECISECKEVVRVKEFKDGSALINYLLTNNDNLPDAIISDMKMPVKDGTDVLRFLKESKKFEHIPVIIFSTSSGSFDKENCFELGAKAFFSKPSSFTGIKVAVKEIISLCREFNRKFKMPVSDVS